MKTADTAITTTDSSPRAFAGAKAEGSEHVALEVDYAPAPDSQRELIEDALCYLATWALCAAKQAQPREDSS